MKWTFFTSVFWFVNTSSFIETIFDQSCFLPLPYSPIYEVIKATRLTSIYIFQVNPIDRKIIPVSLIVPFINTEIINTSYHSRNSLTRNKRHELKTQKFIKPLISQHMLTLQIWLVTWWTFLKYRLTYSILEIAECSQRLLSKLEHQLVQNSKLEILAEIQVSPANNCLSWISHDRRLGAHPPCILRHSEAFLLVNAAKLEMAYTLHQGMHCINMQVDKWSM